MDHEMLARNFEKASSLMEQGGDWDRRNRLKVYEGTYALARRDFKKASHLFLDTVSTFTSVEIMEYSSFVSMTVLASAISLDRVPLKEKVCGENNLSCTGGGC